MKTDAELIKELVENYLNRTYQLSLNDLDQWYGHRLCKFITTLKNEHFEFIDIEKSATPTIVTQEINNDYEYNFADIDFQPDDVVIDIGANIGMVSIYLAKKFPYLKIYSFEPVTINFRNFEKNIKLNNIPNNIITPIHKAVTGDGKPVTLMFCPDNSGGSGVYTNNSTGYIIKNEDKDLESITLDDIFKEFNIKKVKLLKIDCEGSEFSILKNCKTSTLKKIENLIGEFHQDLKSRPDCYNDQLIDYCKKYIENVNIKAIDCT